MTFGIWFERGKKKELPLEVRLAVDRAIDFLAPYFGLSLNDDEMRDKIGLPEIEVSYKAGYFRDVIYLPADVVEGSSSIGHEVGHWFHNRINPSLYPVVPPCSGLNYLLTEIVANYSGLIYRNKRNPFQNPRFSLLELAKMSLNEAILKQTDLNNFNSQIFEENLTEDTKELVEKR